MVDHFVDCQSRLWCLLGLALFHLKAGTVDDLTVACTARLAFLGAESGLVPGSDLAEALLVVQETSGVEVVVVAQELVSAVRGNCVEVIVADFFPRLWAIGWLDLRLGTVTSVVDVAVAGEGCCFVLDTDHLGLVNVWWLALIGLAGEGPVFLVANLVVVLSS